MLSYAALVKIKLFGEKDEAFNHVLSFVIALFAIVQFASNDPTAFFASLFSRAAVVIIVAFVGYLVLESTKSGGK